MFRIVNRLIQWTGKYKRRIYIGFVYAFIHSIFTAIPIMLAAKKALGGKMVTGR